MSIANISNGESGLSVRGKLNLVIDDINAGLSDLSNLSKDDGAFVVGNGSTFVQESGNTARTSLGLGTGDSPTFNGLTVSGDLIVNGTTTTINSTTVTTADNTIVLNNGEVGAGVTDGSAGIQIDRGTETDYQFIFRESDDSFVIGEIGSLQSVATRQDAPSNGGLSFWNDGQKRFDTSANATLNSSGEITAAELTVGAVTFSSVSTDLNTAEADIDTVEDDVISNYLSIDALWKDKVGKNSSTTLKELELDNDLILSSPNGTRYAIRVTDVGVVEATEL